MSLSLLVVTNTVVSWSAIINIYNNYGNSKIRAENKDDAANCNSLP